MPRSEFTELTLTADKRVGVKGVVDPPDARVHWMVAQGDVIGAGVAAPTTDGFEDVEAQPQARWERGKGATAVGVQVQVGRRADGGLTIETFTWSQELQLVDV